MRRKKMSRRRSRKNYSKGTRVHKKNAQGRPMRGGIRL